LKNVRGELSNKTKEKEIFFVSKTTKLFTMKNNDLALFFVAIKTNILCDADD